MEPDKIHGEMVRDHPELHLDFADWELGFGELDEVIAKEFGEIIEDVLTNYPPWLGSLGVKEDGEITIGLLLDGFAENGAAEWTGSLSATIRACKYWGKEDVRMLSTALRQLADYLDADD